MVLCLWRFCGVWVGRLVSCFRGFGYGVGWVGWLFEFADLVVWFMVGYGGLGVSVWVTCRVVFSSWSVLSCWLM